jgi:DNA helicase MCM8
LSRFDLVFILLDKPDEDRDQLISEHILGMSGNNHGTEENNNFSFLQRSLANLDDNEDNKIKIKKEEEKEMTFTQRIRKDCRIISKEQSKSKKRNFSSFNSDYETHEEDDSSAVFHLTSEQMKRYIEYAKQYVHPVLTPEAAKILQKMYLTMRATSVFQSDSSSSSKSGGGGLPVTTRHLESMIRLCQARARMELRMEVTEKDAKDIIQLLQESLLDIFTTETGQIDIIGKGKSGGIMSLSKQMKALIRLMNKEAVLRGNNMFTRQEIHDLSMKLQLTKEVDELIELMRTECYLLLKGPKLYQLQTV